MIAGIYSTISVLYIRVCCSHQNFFVVDLGSSTVKYVSITSFYCHLCASMNHLISISWRYFDMRVFECLVSTARFNF